MSTCLYLDTARLGQMCPEAQRADRDFARLAGEEAGSLYYDLFLRAGFFSLPPSLRSRYPGLADWSGVPALKSRIKTALGLPARKAAAPGQPLGRTGPTGLPGPLPPVRECAGDGHALARVSGSPRR